MNKLFFITGLLFSFWLQGYTTGTTTVPPNNNSKFAYLSGDIPGLKDETKVSVDVFNYGVITHEPFKLTKDATVKNGKFRSEIKIQNTYANFILTIFSDKGSESFGPFIIYPGNNLQLKVKDNQFYFSGNGSDLANVQLSLNKIYIKHFGAHIVADGQSTIIRYFEKMDSCFIEQYNFINACHLRDDQKNLLKRNCYLGDEISKMAALGYSLPADKEGIKRIADLYEVYKQQRAERLKRAVQIPVDLSKSNDYPKYLLGKYKYDSVLLQLKDFDLAACYNFFLKKFPGKISETIIVNLLHSYKGSSDTGYEGLLDVSEKVLREKVFRDYAAQLMVFKKGRTGYNFQLKDERDKVWRFEDFRGNVIVLDFWFTGCGNCVQLKPYMDKIEENFDGKPVKFLTVNYDDQESMWLKSLAGGKYTSNRTLNLSTAPNGEDHPLLKYYRITGAPTILVFDKEGGIFPTVTDPRADNGKQLTDIIESLLQ